MLRKLHAQGYTTADHLLAAICRAGYWLTPGTKVLDFGCGQGQLVYEFRDVGFDAYGFDLHDYVSYRSPEDRRLFGFIDTLTTDTADHVVSADLFRLPFDDNSFDVIVSTSAIEHVMDTASTMRELARVLKPEGFCFHIYPPRSWLIEPHIYVPLGTRLRWYWYLYFWALVGIRNGHQEGLDAKTTAERNHYYMRTGVNYMSPREMRRRCRPYFDDVRHVDRALYYPDRLACGWRNFWSAIASNDKWHSLSRGQLQSALLLAGKKSGTPAAP